MNQAYYPRIIREFEADKDDQPMAYLEVEYD